MSEAHRQTQSKDPGPACTTTGTARNSPIAARVAMTLAGLIVLFTLTAPAQISRNFPGLKSEIGSPDGRFVIQNVDHNDDRQHFLLLKDETTGKSREVYEYGRNATVAWSPDSRYFAINDYAGSNFTETYIFSIDETTPKINVQDELLHKGKVIPTGGHDYFGVVRWLDGQRVVIHHWGHSDDPPAKAFCECYLYTLHGSVVKCSHQPKSDDPERLCGNITP